MFKTTFRGFAAHTNSARRAPNQSSLRLAREARARLCRALAPGWAGTKQALRRAVSSALKAYRKNLALLARIIRDARFASLVAAAFLSGGALPALASPPIELSAIAAGTGGFAINGIDLNDFSGNSVSSAGDVNGDGLADLIVGAYRADPGGDNYGGESYVVFGKTGGTTVELTFKYTDAEIAGIAEGALRVFKAPAASGPWTEQVTTLDAARNEAKATVTSFSFFTLAESGTTVPVELSEFSIE